jgi:ComEC/Rec2-related protein
MRRRITPALVLFAAALATLLAAPRAGSAALLAAAALPASAAVVLLAARAPALRRAGTLAAAGALGLALGAGALHRIDATLEGGRLRVDPGDVVELQGVLRADSLLSADGSTLLRLRVDETSTRTAIAAEAGGDALIVVRGDWRFSAGEELSVRSELEPLASAGRERYRARVNRDAVHRRGFSSPVWMARARVREALQRAIAGVGYPASALLEALLIGAREDVPADVREAFRATGSLHVLALSGLHAGIVFAFVAAVLRPLRNRIAVFLAGCAVLTAYLFVAGLMPSLVRAVVMLTVGAAARLADRDDEPMNLLAISGIVILAADPFAAGSLSFQLSFLALAGILSFGPLVMRLLEGRVPAALAAPFAASAGAQAGTLPVVLLAFGAWYPSGIAAALLLVPLVTVFLWLGLAWLAVFPLIGRLASPWAAWLFDGLYRGIGGVGRLFARVPGIYVAPRAAAVWAAAAGAAVLALALLAPRGSRSGIPWAR